MGRTIKTTKNARRKASIILTLSSHVSWSLKYAAVMRSLQNVTELRKNQYARIAQAINQNLVKQGNALKVLQTGKRDNRKRYGIPRHLLNAETGGKCGSPMKVEEV